MINTTFSNLADTLAEQVRGGGIARQQIGDTSVAFGWSEGLPPIVARYVESASISGLSFDATRVKPSGTPVAAVGPGLPKPAALTLEAVSVPLVKYAGLVEFNLETILSTTALLPAVQASLVGQSLVAYDAACVAALAAAGGPTASGATWSGAILAGIAAVAAQGQNPSLLVLAPADYAAAVEDAAPVFSLDPTSGATALYGLTLAVTVGGIAGTAYVMDSRAAVAVQNEHSPMITIDPFSKADLNVARLVSDLIAGFFVTQPAGVAKITVTAGQLGSKGDYALGA